MLCVLLTVVVTLSGAVVGKSICMAVAKCLDRRKGGYSNAVSKSQVESGINCRTLPNIVHWRTEIRRRVHVSVA